ncbi:hypothetical protein CVU82_02250 [Candidatus Falkowbacteria bacterium HGW-Falkowbacteria-1]|uniref:Glycosyltransferase n=1 Tax=Candidatus Falkowbacteria bacterium HGW-Falkowbacteria-1 TaxID=2013768 RepID=A0A2N2E9P0_9BACT|nr:MAG: hypothetical protein CVU82_02250 [Candidatus Falkowbacteria bacterium HGW-Falkowbacteria-1]
MNNTKIKILYIIPSLSSGGAERFVLDLICNLDRNIFEPNLLMFNGGGFFLDDLKQSNIEYKILNKKYKIDLLNFCRIYRYIKKNKPDIVHTQLGGDVYGKIAAKLAGIKKIVSTEQNVNDNDNKLISFLKKRTACFSNKVIAISEAVKSDVIKKYNISQDKVDLIYNGLNLSNFSNISKVKENGEKIIFGSVGRLSEQKNFSLLFKALSSFKNKNFECLIVGVGELKGQLEQEIVDLNLQDKVYLLGERKNVADFLSKLDFFVLPSKWEGLGVVLLEAGALSLPVLASATGGILDVIKDNKTGILFENDNLEDLIDKLSYFFDRNNYSDLKLLGTNLHDLILDKFDIKKISKKYEDMYLNLN